jgi:polyisoprenoid-binding protein YceI
VLLPTAARAEAVQWTPDLVHSRAEFTVAHMVLSKVWGHFPIRELAITTNGASLVPTSVNATLDVAHMDTDNHTRDADLRSETYFDTEKYPTMTFKSTKIVPVDAADFNMTGDLTIKNVTKSITIPVHILGKVPDDRGTRVGYEGKVTIDRRDFGITDSRLMSGVLFVGYPVEIGITAEASSTLPYTK